MNRFTNRIINYYQLFLGFVSTTNKLAIVVSIQYFINVNPNHANASPLTVGFPNIVEDLNFNTGDSAAEHLVKNLITTSLFGTISNPDTEESMDSSAFFEGFSSDSDGVNWSFIIKSDLQFSNGQKVILEDITNSLNNCQILKQAGVIAINSIELNKIDITFEEKLSTRAEKISSLVKCPIFSKQLQTYFMNQHARNTNLIARGYYKFSQIQPLKKIILTRNFLMEEEIVLPEEIILNKYQNADKGLAELRSGKYDIIFVENSNLQEKIDNDSTLDSTECYDHTAIYRKTLKLICDSKNDILFVNSLQYDTNAD
jgi:ABC-type transport system substrate-binding protein